MAGLGAGLGAFVEGIGTGMKVRQAIDDSIDRRRLDRIGEDTEAAFGEAVKGGQADANDYESFWKQYALPKMRQELLAQRDFDGLQKLDEWGASAGALKGGKLFASAMLKVQTGDYGGALDDAIDAAKVKGYMDHDYELTDKTPLTGEDGSVVGYRITVKGADGKELQQDVPIELMPKLVATYLNPDAAWQSQVEASKKKEDRESELDDYRAKKKIEREENDDPRKRYEAARKELSENDIDGDFADLSPEDQDAAIRARVQAANDYAASVSPATQAPAPAGAAAGPQASTPAAGKVVVDNVTGVRVGAPDPAAQQPGLGAPKGPTRDQLIAAAATSMQQGGDPNQIAGQLRKAGIAEQEWPQALRSAVAGGLPTPTQ